MNWALISTMVAAIMATTMIFVRAKAAKNPTTVKKIILPPLFMSTGALMFLFPTFQLSFYQVIEAFGVGMICSIFLIRTSNFEIQNNEIYLIPSKAFIIIISILLIIRIGMKLMFGQVIAFGELSGMFYLLALGMIGTWRVAMLVKFIALKRSLH
ncbi:MAG TPA: cytochrome c biogenesis protein CcdC [Bacillota bacterium]|nr:cytochrome c biogenesis protein CcdC [Bacillota bacterium]